MGFVSILNLIRQGDFSEAKKKLKEYLDTNQVKSDDVSLVYNYYTSSNSQLAGYVLFRMQCAVKMYYEAYETYMSLLKKCARKKDISLSDVVNNASYDEIVCISCDFMNKLNEDIDIPQSLLVSEVIDEIIPALWNSKDEGKYKIITNIAELMWFEELKTSNYLYEIAYSAAKTDSKLAEKLYLKLIEKEPANSIALNEMGHLYEKCNDLDKAKLYYGRASKFCANKESYRTNYERVVTVYGPTS